MSKLSDALDELQEAREELTDTQLDMADLFEAIRREHEDRGHVGTIRWCPRPACALVTEIGQRG